MHIEDKRFLVKAWVSVTFERSLSYAEFVNDRNLETEKICILQAIREALIGKSEELLTHPEHLKFTVRLIEND